MCKAPDPVEKGGWYSGPPYAYLDRHAEHLGLTPVIPVSELNLGARDEYLGDGLRTCSDARFCRPIVPRTLRRRVPSPDRERCRWPLSSVGFSDHPSHLMTSNEAYYDAVDDKAFKEEFQTSHFKSVAIDRELASGKFYRNGGNVVPLDESVLVVMPSKSAFQLSR